MRTSLDMHTKSFTGALTVLGFAALSVGLLACNATSQGLNSRQFDNLPAAKSGRPASQPTADAALTLNLDLSVEEAYAAIPHRRTAMDFAAANMPERDKHYLSAAFHLIDQAVRLRVAAYQRFSRGDAGAAQLISDMDRVIDCWQHLEAPADLSTYHRQLRQALADQRAFFAEWRSAGQGFRHGGPDELGSHPKVQSASAALRAAYEILMRQYPDEGSNNRDAFFDYHCALDFL
jgi:hypothetical protein